MKSGKEDLGQRAGGGTGGLVQGARAGTVLVGNAGPLSLQILRIDREGIIDIKMHMTSFVQKYFWSPNTIYTT